MTTPRARSRSLTVCIDEQVAIVMTASVCIAAAVLVLLVASDVRVYCPKGTFPQSAPFPVGASSTWFLDIHECVVHFASGRVSF